MSKYDTHQMPLSYIGTRSSRRWYRCERCRKEFSERTPTIFAGCCDSRITEDEVVERCAAYNISRDEAIAQLVEIRDERENDAYMEHGQPGGIA